MNHDHHECDHNLKYCKQCRVVYCTKCSKEWRDYSQSLFNPWVYPSCGQTTYHSIGKAIGKQVGGVISQSCEHGK
jgi:hypothetical protein